MDHWLKPLIATTTARCMWHAGSLLLKRRLRMAAHRQVCAIPQDLTNILQQHNIAVHSGRHLFLFFQQMSFGYTARGFGWPGSLHSCLCISKYWCGSFSKWQLQDTATGHGAKVYIDIDLYAPLLLGVRSEAILRQCFACSSSSLGAVSIPR